MTSLDPAGFLPEDFAQALLVGRVWRSGGDHEGPSVVLVRAGEVFDITAFTPTTADLLDRDDLLRTAVRNSTTVAAA